MLDAFDNRGFKIGLWIFAALILIFLILPTLIVVPLSFSGSDLLQFPPRSFSLRWYDSFFGSTAWMHALRTSLVLGVLTAAIAVPISLMTSIAMNRLGGLTSKTLYTYILSPSVIPGILLAIGLFFVLANLGLIGTLRGVLIGHVVLALPVTVIVLHPAVTRFDWGQVNAARSMGAGWIRAITHILLPQLSFTLMTAALMAFLTSLDEAVISIFIAAGDSATLPKLMFMSLRDQIDPTIAAISTLWSVVVISVVLIVNAIRSK
ncbi:ABC transporter permease [Thioclava kandeliae]|uniref:ABC transporter permease n=1 Tax=Thioclava kandeliae TaxID=3070818 RepID=A0ABV1SJG1_9RHOB